MGKKDATPQPENTQETGARDRTGRFAPGSTGNAGGRPKALAALKASIQVGGLALVEALQRIASGESERERRGRKTVVVIPSCADRIQAIKLLLAYAYGRPTLAIEVTGRAGGPIEGRDLSEMNSAERREYLRALLAKAAVKAAVAQREGNDDGSDDKEEDTDA